MKNRHLNSKQISNIWDNNAERFTEHYSINGDSDREMIINPVIFKLLGDVSDKVILDAGCGEGYLSRLLANSCKKVISVDYSKEMLSIAKEKTINANIEYFHASIENIGFIKDNSIDLAISVTVFQDIPDYISAIKEIHRVLKKNTNFILVVTHPCFSSPCHGWYTDNNGYKLFWKSDNYFKEGLNKSLWTDNEGKQELIYFHRTLETYFSALTENGFTVRSIKEPKPNKNGILKYPWLLNDLRVAHYIVFDCINEE